MGGFIVQRVQYLGRRLDGYGVTHHAKNIAAIVNLYPQATLNLPQMLIELAA